MAAISQWECDRVETLQVMHAEAATLGARVAELERAEAEARARPEAAGDESDEAEAEAEAEAAARTMRLSEARYAHQQALGALAECFPQIITAAGDSRAKLAMGTEGLTASRDALADRAVEWGVSRTSEVSRRTFADLRERNLAVGAATPLNFRDIRERDMTEFKDTAAAATAAPGGPESDLVTIAGKVLKEYEEAKLLPPRFVTIADDEALARELQEKFDRENASNISGDSSSSSGNDEDDNDNGDAASSPTDAETLPSSSPYSGTGAWDSSSSHWGSGDDQWSDDDRALQLALAESVLSFNATSCSTSSGTAAASSTSNDEELNQAVESHDDEDSMQALPVDLTLEEPKHQADADADTEGRAQMVDADADADEEEDSQMVDADVASGAEAEAEAAADAEAPQNMTNVPVEGIVHFAQEYMFPREEFGRTNASGTTPLMQAARNVQASMDATSSEEIGSTTLLMQAARNVQISMEATSSEEIGSEVAAKKKASKGVAPMCDDGDESGAVSKGDEASNAHFMSRIGNLANSLLEAVVPAPMSGDSSSSGSGSGYNKLKNEPMSN